MAVHQTFPISLPMKTTINFLKFYSFKFHSSSIHQSFSLSNFALYTVCKYFIRFSILVKGDCVIWRDVSNETGQ